MTTNFINAPAIMKAIISLRKNASSSRKLSDPISSKVKLADNISTQKYLLAKIKESKSWVYIKTQTVAKMIIMILCQGMSDLLWK